jgi:hypothetical protein
MIMSSIVTSAVRRISVKARRHPQRANPKKPVFDVKLFLDSAGLGRKVGQFRGDTRKAYRPFPSQNLGLFRSCYLGWPGSDSWAFAAYRLSAAPAASVDIGPAIAPVLVAPCFDCDLRRKQIDIQSVNPLGAKCAVLGSVSGNHPV